MGRLNIDIYLINKSKPKYTFLFKFRSWNYFGSTSHLSIKIVCIIFPFHFCFYIK